MLWNPGLRGTLWAAVIQMSEQLLTCPDRCSAGVSQVSTQGAYVTFATTVGTANSLLNTTFMKFENAAAGVSKIRTTEYSIPSTLTSYIDLIDPTVFLGKTVAAVCSSQLLNGGSED